MTAHSILRKRALSKQHVSGALAAGWARVSAKVGKGAFADRVEISTGTVDNALTGKSVPELHTALNSLMVDHTALDETLALYGLKVCPLAADAANDMATAADLSHLAGALIEALSDGVRNHTETLALADRCRPLVKALSALVQEADAIKLGEVA